MKKTSFLFLLVVTGQCFSQKEPLRTAVGDQAPDLKVAYWLKGDPGAGIEPGKINVVEFWATWCHPCMAGIPHLSELAAQYRDQKVRIFGISILERKKADRDSLKRFIRGANGEKMHYIVGADDSAGYMRKNWYAATGDGGIPYAVVIDKEGKIAWTGPPVALDKIIRQMVDGQWDLAAARHNFFERRMLDSIDASYIPEFNGYIRSKDFKRGMRSIDSLVAKIPGLRYHQNTAHFTFVFLIRLDPGAAIAFARKAWEVNEVPDWKSVSDMIFYCVYAKLPLPPSAYLLGVDALQAQIDHYPWSMDFPETYNDMASFEYLAGNKEQAIADEEKAIGYAGKATEAAGKTTEAAGKATEAAGTGARLQPGAMAKYRSALKKYRG